MTEPLVLGSRDNPLLQRLRKLARDGGAYRKSGEVWLEGEHLCSALRARGQKPVQALIAESAWQRTGLRELAGWAPRIARVPDALFDGISGLESPARIGFVLPVPAPAAIDPLASSIVLDRLQDAGNVGSILRSASAFGFRQVLALQGTALMWSPKVLRAGMGAHFGLRLLEGLKPEDLQPLSVPWIGTSLQAETWLHDASLPNPCAWLFGHEGQGVDAALLARCALTVRIAQPGGEESLNVAAAAAVCLHESMRRTWGQ